MRQWTRVAFLRSALFYLCGFAAAAVLAALLLGVGRPRTAPPGTALDDAATAAWMLGITSLPGAAGFAAVACASRAWRALRATTSRDRRRVRRTRLRRLADRPRRRGRIRDPVPARRSRRGAAPGPAGALLGARAAGAARALTPSTSETA
jgi:hypothetical protein